MKKYVSLLFIVLLFSCTSDNTEEAENELLTKSASLAEQFWEDFEILLEHFEESGLPNDLTQEYIDFCVELIGSDEEVPVELAENIFSEIGDYEEFVFSEWVETTEFEAFTKSTMLTLAEGEWISDLHENENFVLLPMADKEYLLFLNEVMRYYEENQLDHDHSIVLRTHETWEHAAPFALVGAAIGGSGGSVIGGVAGFFMGGIIGATIGSLSGHK